MSDKRINTQRTGYQEIFFSHQGKLSNKWSSYVDYYQEILAKYRKDRVKILEIGVQNGGSLEILAKYFDQAQIVLGCDIDEKCGALKFEDPRINIIIGNTSDNKTFSKIRDHKYFEIIFDDGSHTSNDIILNFMNYFPLVAPGGIYIVEDTHFVHQTRVGLQEYRGIDFFKRISDLPNLQFWQGQRDPFDHLSGFFSPTPIHQIGQISVSVDAVEFRNSMITIRKSKKDVLDKLGLQSIVGTVALVDNTPLLIRNARQHDDNQ